MRSACWKEVAVSTVCQFTALLPGMQLKQSGHEQQFNHASVNSHKITDSSNMPGHHDAMDKTKQQETPEGASCF